MFKIILLFMLLLTSCASQNSSKKIIHEYSEIENITLDYHDVFKIDDYQYYLYYFQRNCFHCQGIKSEIISYALNNQNLYFIEVIDISEFTSMTIEDTLGTNDPLMAFSMSTPQLSLVIDKTINNTWIGQDDILTELHKNEHGN